MEMYNSIGLVLTLLVSVFVAEAAPYHRHEMSSCEGVEDGFYINSGSNCQSYTYCHQGIADVFRCLPGTVFSEKHGRCAREEDVYCDAAYTHGAPGEEGGEGGGDLSDAEIQNDLMMLKAKLEKEKAAKAEEVERKRQIKFRELRDLLDTLKSTLQSDRKDEKGQVPPK